MRIPDPPRGEEYWVAADDEFQHAEDLVRYIRRVHGDAFCIGVAGSWPILNRLRFQLIDDAVISGYPEGHADSEDKLADVEYLFQKQEAGADFVVTQLFYDVDAFIVWYRACRARGRSTSFYLPVDIEMKIDMTRDHYSDFTGNHADSELSIFSTNDESLQVFHPGAYRHRSPTYRGLSSLPLRFGSR